MAISQYVCWLTFDYFRETIGSSCKMISYILENVCFLYHGAIRLRAFNSFPWTNGHQFGKCIFMNEKFCILIRIPTNFVSKGIIDNTAALVKLMAWRRIGDKPLSEPMLTQFIDVDMRH